MTAHALQGAGAVDTCSIATAVVALCCLPGFNFLGAQGIRLWYEYNLADERMKVSVALQKLQILWHLLLG